MKRLIVKWFLIIIVPGTNFPNSDGSNKEKMAGKVKSQNLSIMLTDLQGYTATSTKCSREEIISLIRGYNQLLSPIIEFYGGRIIKTIGDAFLATFGSATDGVICAIIIQLVLKEYNAQQQTGYLKMNTRVVVHSGDVSIENNDIYGDAVNVTARIEGLECFPGGSIGISETTYLLMDKNEIVAEKIGPQKLKGIPEPITVYSVPLEKQKLKKTPDNLSKLITRVLSPEGSQGVTRSMEEWKSSIHTFLKEKNWGENITQFGENLAHVKSQIGENLAPMQKQIGQNVGKVQKQLVDSFGQKTVLAKKEAKSLQEAETGKRVKSFVIDSVVLAILLVSLSFGWWITERMVYGSVYLTDNEYSNLKHGEDNFSLGNDGNYYRKKGILEWIISINVSFPILLMMGYFAIGWGVKGASPGQIVSQTAVVMEDGSPITWKVAFVRAGVFVFSVVLVFGPAMALIGEKKTFYDKFCKTRVVE